MSLGALDSDSGTDSDTDSESVKKPNICFKDLSNIGYISGPSILTMKPATDDVIVDWSWSKRDSKDSNGSTTLEEREAMRDAVTRGVNETAAAALKAQEEEKKRKEMARSEKERVGREQRLKRKAISSEKHRREMGGTL
eukprot:CAMPEP_0175065632 /NCGR_PEP_ID=MMETSP0052_2-20121109/16045_1 /TAXON_ID=51329 ORGANISM="Polytomella parva, Strain SAG 63-3" /NCGR_SAMPLE_ID=MMETSP0052_2 /ASSEMBLY_ACC=CAM_ASM_000194 /LENGTH=138 /DNA_ID=CAMNT_0016332213 /DNA_START=192 /DNA_END=604 /DNA_ORIENTATION=+